MAHNGKAKVNTAITVPIIPANLCEGGSESLLDRSLNSILQLWVSTKGGYIKLLYSNYNHFRGEFD